MSELQVTPGIKFSGDDRPETLDLIGMAETSQVWLWDMGPEKPVEPKKPIPPKGRDGDPDYEIEKVVFADALVDYKDALELFKTQKKEYAVWLRRVGGPIEVLFASPDARDAQVNDLRAVDEGRQTKTRWQNVSSRTRGYSKLPNRGLPAGVTPGRGQADQERRMAEGDAELVAARRADPIFGKQELRQ